MNNLENIMVISIKDNNKQYDFCIGIRLDDNDEFYVDMESCVFPDFFDTSVFDLRTMRFENLTSLRSQIMMRIDDFLNENLQRLG